MMLFGHRPNSMLLLCIRTNFAGVRRGGRRLDPCFIREHPWLKILKILFRKILLTL